MEFPDEIWVLIFRKYLDGIETIRCRILSKRFKFLIDRFCLNELLVYDHNSSWKNPDSLLHEPYEVDREPDLWIQLFEFNLKPNSSFPLVFARLKFLQINRDLRKAFNLEIFNELVCLERLLLPRVIISRSQTLKLPRLKVFSINLVSKRDGMFSGKVQERINYDREPRLVLDSKVERLADGNQKLLVLKHSECIEVLHLRSNSVESEKLIQFKNLRVLNSKLTQSLLDAFERLEKLEELHLDVCFGGRVDKEVVIKRQPLIDRLMSLRLQLKRKTKVYIQGILWPFEGTFCRFPTELRIRNYHKLADCVESMREDYSDLVEYLDRQRDNLTRNGVVINEYGFPVCFFKKNRNIRYVEFSKIIEDEDRFLWFLSQCSRLMEIKIYLDRLSQSLFNRLPMVCGQLKELCIYSNGSELDLSPVYKLNRLFRLTVHSEEEKLEWPLDLALLFEKCKYLVEVRLKYIRVKKTRLYSIRLFIEDWQKNGPYNHEELKSALNEYFEEYKEALSLRV